MPSAGVAPLPRARSTVDLAAEAVRGHIMSGLFRPGAALTETGLAQSLRVSRNTVREALRQLAGSGLVVVEPHRGAFVRTLTVADVADIYRARRRLELSAVDLISSGAGVTFHEAPDAAEANRRFHVDLVRAHDSRRLDDFFAGLMTEMRLGFLSLPDPAAFHASYRPRNQAIARRLREGSFEQARADLAVYLADAEAQVTEAVARDA